jgi:hypothetical protein
VWVYECMSASAFMSWVNVCGEVYMSGCMYGPKCICVCESMSASACGCGCMSVWEYGCMGVWVYGSMGVWCVWVCGVCAAAAASGVDPRSVLGQTRGVRLVYVV